MLALLFISSGLLAQEQVEVNVKVKKDGELVKDTTYLFDDVSEAKQAMKMMDVMSGEDAHMEHITYNYTSALPEGAHTRAMVFISEDGESTEIKEIHEDSLVWITEKKVDGDHVKVLKYKIKEGEEPHGEHVVIKKEIKVVVSEDDDATWHVEGDDEIKMKVMKIMEDEAEGEKVKVIVIEGGEDADVDHDHDVDMDHEHDVDVEVKVIKKKEEK